MASFAALKTARQGRQRGWTGSSSGTTGIEVEGAQAVAQPVGGAKNIEGFARPIPWDALAGGKQAIASSSTKVKAAAPEAAVVAQPDREERRQELPTPAESAASATEEIIASDKSKQDHSALEALLDLPFYLEIRSSPSSGRSVFLRPSSSSTSLPSTSIGAVDASPVRNGRIPRGSTILRTSPAVAALSTSELNERCSACWLMIGEICGPGGIADGSAGERALRKCAGCGVVRYCSRNCQAHDWPAHQSECASLRAATQPSQQAGTSKNGATESAAQLPSENVRALGRICWTRRKAKEKGDATSERMWKQVSALESHRKSLSNSQSEPFAALAMALARYLHSGQAASAGGEQTAMDMRASGFESVAEVMDLCCAFATNSFTLASPSLHPLGVASSPAIAMFNHSCEPNAVVVFPNGGEGRRKGAGGGDWRGMEVIALREIEEGEEILTSYVDVTLPVHLRQKDLERYHFTCRCSLCQADERARAEGKPDSRWATKHPGCGRGEGPAAMPADQGQSSNENPRCDACGSTFAVDAARIHKMIKRGQAMLDRSARGEQVTPADISAATQVLLAVLPITSHPLPALLRLEATTLSSPSPGSEAIPDLFAAIRASSLSFKALESLLPFGHPVRGIVLAEMGKLLNLERDDVPDAPSAPTAPDSAAPFLPRELAGRLHLARETLVKALSELRVGFGGEGGGGMVGRELVVLVEGVTREMQARRLL